MDENIDWMQTAIISIQTIILAVAAYFSYKTITSYKDQLKYKEETGIAQDLVLFSYACMRSLYEARGSVLHREVSFPVGFVERITPQNKMVAASYYYACFVLDEDAVYFDRLKELRSKAEYFFGSDVSKAIDEICDMKTQVRVSSIYLAKIMLGEDAGGNDEDVEFEVNKARCFASNDSADPYFEHLNSCSSVIIARCGRIVETRL